MQERTGDHNDFTFFCVKVNLFYDIEKKENRVYRVLTSKSKGNIIWVT